MFHEQFGRIYFKWIWTDSRAMGKVGITQIIMDMDVKMFVLFRISLTRMNFWFFWGENKNEFCFGLYVYIIACFVSPRISFCSHKPNGVLDREKIELFFILRFTICEMYELKYKIDIINW